MMMKVPRTGKISAGVTACQAAAASRNAASGNSESRGIAQEIVRRLEALKPDAQRQWGKMSVAQMLEHNSHRREGQERK